METKFELLKEAQKLSTNRGRANKEFIKTIITIATGFLALFIGLKSNGIASENARYLFFLTIVLLVVGIVFLAISLYQEIYFLKKNESFLKEKISKYLKKGTIEKILFNYTKQPLFFKICEPIGYCAFLLATIALIGYVFFLEFP